MSEDPFTWSIDRVVYEFCQNPQPIWAQGGNAKPIPDAQSLEDVLRKNHVDGENLLQLNAETLRADLDIKSFGQKNAILKAIGYLRNNSLGYRGELQRQRQEIIQNQDVSSRDAVELWRAQALHTPQQTVTRVSHFSESPKPHLDIYPTVESVGAHIPALKRDSDTHPGEQWLGHRELLQNAYSLPPALGHPASALSRSVNSLPAQTRLSNVLSEQVFAGMPGAFLQDKDVFKTNILDTVRQSDNDAENVNLQATVQEPKPQPPVNNFLDHIDAVIDQGLGKDEVTLQAGEAQDADNAKSLSDTVGPSKPKEKKRIAPSTVSHNELYLYHRPVSLEDYFFPLPDDDLRNFNFAYPQRPAAQQVHVKHLMQYFLQQRPTEIPGTTMKVVVPYASRRKARASATQSVIVATHYQDTSVQNIETFPVLLQEASTSNKDQSSINDRTSASTDPNPFLTAPLLPDQQDRESAPVQANDDLGEYQALLERYPVQTEDDEEVISVGDVRQEEVDEETWAEIQRDVDEDTRSVNPSNLTQQEVIDAINQAIVELKEEWENTKLLRVQRKAYRDWKRWARQGLRPAKLDEMKYWKEHSEHSIGRLRDFMSNMSWSKVDDVKAQCVSLEETVGQLKESDYYVRVLSSTTVPERPLMDSNTIQAAARPRPVLAADEEVLESESDDNNFIASESSESEVEDIPYREVLEIPQSPRAEHQREVSDEVPQSPFEVLDPEDSPRTRSLHTPLEDPVASGAISDDEIITPAMRRKMNSIKKDPHDTRQSSTDSPANHWNTTMSKDLPFGNSDMIDHPAPPAKSLHSQLGTSKLQAIDLTLSSPIVDPYKGDESDFDVQTPDLNPLDDSPLEQTDPHHKGPEQGLLSGSDASSPRIVLSQPSGDPGLPSPEDVLAMRALDWEIILAFYDRLRALAKAVYSLSSDQAAQVQDYVQEYSKQNSVNFRGHLQICLISFKKGLATPNARHKGPKGRTISALLFLTYINIQNISKVEDASQAEIDAAFASLDQPLRRFFHFLKIYLEALRPQQNILSSLEAKNPKGKRKYSNYQDDSLDDSDLQILTSDEHTESADEDPSPHKKKRKRIVHDSQEAKNLQLDDKRRVQDQEERRALMEKKLLEMDVAGDLPQHIINSIEPPIVLHQKIARRVKPHQVRGIQFMWREIVEDKKHQGCLLAHTMGLGKTMQVISLLVTIAEANESQDPAIRLQVPPHLQAGKILILCPPTLLDNWYDELAMWIPYRNMLGIVIKISPKQKESSKRADIRTWATNGGVLLLSYNKFQAYVLPREKQNNADPEIADIGKILLEEPSIIIADEAHKMKNAASKIHIAAKQFQSVSRVALTGSPLNNHLEEYHTMVNWIAPGYLGDMVQFRVKYSEPIQAGLYADSTTSERRTALRKLHVLKRDLDPKINRADITAIAKDMPPKTEFFITLELTAVQKEAYRTYVKEVTGSADLSTLQHAQACLFDWLAILSLLCNHPSCFVKKLDKRMEEAETANSKTPTAMEDDAGDADEEGPPTPDMSSAEAQPLITVMERAKEALHAAMLSQGINDIDDVALSNRSLIVKEIIEHSVKLGDRILLFSQSIPTLDYLEELIGNMGLKYLRLTGETPNEQRHAATKMFNNKAINVQVFLISTRAGGLGLNLQGANRVILYDFGFNPTWEEQAIGRAYRLGQKRPVFVYRFRSGSTFEEIINQKAVFKTQLFQRVVDKKNPERYAQKSISEYLFEPKDVELQDFKQCLGKDTKVLDSIIEHYPGLARNIELTETFTKEDDEVMTAEDIRVAEEEYEDARLQRDDPAAYEKKMAERQIQNAKAAAARATATAATVRMSGNLRPTTSTNFIMPPTPAPWKFQSLSAQAPSTGAAANAVPSPYSTSAPPSFMQNLMGPASGLVQTMAGYNTPVLPISHKTILQPNKQDQLQSYDDQYVRDPPEPQAQDRAKSADSMPQLDGASDEPPSTPGHSIKPPKPDCTPQ